MSVRFGNVLSQRVRTSVTCDGDRPLLPQELGKFLCAEGEKYDQLQLVTIEGELGRNLAASIPFGAWSPWREIPPRRIVDSYLRSVEILQSHAKSFVGFIDQLLDSILQFRLPARRCQSYFSAMQEFRDLVDDKLRYKFPFRPVVVTSDLVVQGSDALLKACQWDLDERVRALSSHLCRVLRNGAKGGLLGHITWLSHDACRFLHYRLNVNLTKVQRSHASPQSFVTETYRHEVACHECHLIDAAQFRGIPGWLRVPTFLEAPLKALPECLLPFISTVDGTLIRERIIAWDVFESQHTHEEEIALRCPTGDPAILIGNIVLMGWTERELSHGVSRGEKLRQGLWRLFDYLQADFEEGGNQQQEVQR